MTSLRLSCCMTLILFVAACGGDDDSGPDCRADETECAGLCIPTQIDADNCGACGNACAAGELCSAGTCALTCSAALTECSDTCRDTTTDRDHCGDCDTACEDGDVCSAGACALSCSGELTDCDGVCRDTTTDRNHCGACGESCENGEICFDSACVLSCPDTLSQCGDICTDLEFDPLHCGECDDACSTANATPACFSGGCLVAACDVGFCDTDGDPGNGCEATVNVMTDADNCGECGVVCPSGACELGECVRRAFVTSNPVAANLGGLAGADATCQSRATAGGLGGQWRAWLADATGSPATRFVMGGSSYQRIDGVVIANNFADLTDGSLDNPLNLTEAGLELTGVDAWSNVTFDGTASSVAIGAHCNGWSVAAGLGGRVGTPGETGALWTDSGSNTCDQTNHLYCFEQ